MPPEQNGILPEQGTQAPPPLPQALALFTWQFPLLSQQPLGQVVVLHVLWHVPFEQVCPEEQGPPVFPQTHLPPTQLSVRVGSQITQAAPPVPQAEVVVAVTHTLPLQQPLGQEAELQMHIPFRH